MSKVVIKELAHNPNNPRTVTEGKLKLLERALHEFGDIGCIVYNRHTKRLVCGHQRSKVIPPDSPIEIIEKYKRPTRSGTVAEGFITIDGEKFKYREVVWDELRETAAAIAANKNAGVFDDKQLAFNLRGLDDSGIADLSMFDGKEREKIFKAFDDTPKKSKNDSRVASDDVKTVSLTFTTEKLEEFNANVAYFQRELQIDNVTDCVAAVLASARVGMETSDENS